MKRRTDTDTPSSNQLCSSCRRTCKQTQAAVVARCPRYYPLHRKLKHERVWTQMELTF